MPIPFDNCVKQGGRVRRVSGPSKEHGLEANEYINYCYLKGKAYRGEKHTKEDVDEQFKCSCIKCGHKMRAPEGKHCMDLKCSECGGQMRRASRPGPGQEGGGNKVAKKKTKEQYEEFAESLTFAIQEESINEEKRTVRVCALAPCISKNNRFYSPAIVETASGTLLKKKSFADHDERTTKNLIGRIIGEELKDGKLYADIKISKAKGIANQTWDKITDGIVTDVSIAADGKTRRIKIGDKYGQEVIELDIKSVDFVTEGGISAAKVMQVFENKEDLPKVSEVKEEMLESVKQLREEYPDFVTKIEEKMKDELDKLRKENEALKLEKIQKELDEFKETTIKKLDTSDKVKDILRGRVSGKTKEELSANIEKEFAYVQSINDATKESAEIDGITPADNKKDKKDTSWTSDRIVGDARIPEDLKVRCAEILIEKGSDEMKKYLKGHKIEI